MMLAVVVVTVAGLYLGRDVLVPIALAVLLSFVLAPLVALLRRLWLGRVPSIIIAVLLALGLILAIGGMIATQLAEVVQDLPRYQFTIRAKVDAVRELTIDRLAAALQRFGTDLRIPGPRPAPQAAPTPAEARATEPVPVEFREANATPLQLVGQVVSPVVNPLVTLFAIVMVSIFILLQKEDLRDRLIRLFGSRDLHRTTAALDDAARRLSKYFLAQLGLNAGFGVVACVGLLVIGVPYPVLWGIVGALLRFVPYVGSLIAAALPALLAAAVDPGWSMMLWTAALMIATEFVIGQFIEPLVYGHSAGLSPVAIVVSAIFWTWLWGIVGLILSTPLALCLVVLGRHIERLEVLDVLLGDRPALTPAESYYQRMLAGDPDEAVEYAELLLKERSLSSYYDEVAVRGLRLAALDAERGALRAEQIGQINEAVRELVTQLDGYADIDPEPGRADDGPAAPPDAERNLAKRDAPASMAPPPEERAGIWRSATPVLCVAGRGVLDDGVALLLAQLLLKHGLDARVVPHDAVSRSNIATLDVEGVAMVCIASIEIEHGAAHLRYLLRRLRQRVPQARFVTGLWPDDDPILGSEDLRRAMNADVYVTTLRAAVVACVDAAVAESAPAMGVAPPEQAA
jgi:predicted PurR-regulated permease PerM